MTDEAYHAVRAARNMRRWGAWAATLYAKKRGVPPELLICAMRLEASK